MGGTQKLIRPEVVGESGMVSAAHPLAAKTGYEVLQNGGNAIDAAVAAAFAIGVVEPFASGLGGGGYAVIHIADTGETVFVDYQSMAPGLSTGDMFVECPSDKSAGYRSILVPGYLAGLTAILGKYGTLDLETVMAPSIEHAEKGFEVTPFLHRVMVEYHEKLLADEWTSRYFLSNGAPYQPGERYSNPDLARTLRMIAQHGPDVFYQGEIAQLMVEMMMANGALIRLEDMAKVRPAFRKPVSINYRGFEIRSSAPTSSGGITLAMILNMLEEFDVAALGHNTTEALHVLAEIARRAFTDRANFLGDPDFVEVPLGGLTSKAYARNRISDFDPLRASSPEKGDPYAYNESPSTTHLSVIDKHGNAVALTQTLCAFFGSGAAVPGYGFVLNNQASAWSVDPESKNCPSPYKRPLSSMTPTIVLREGKPFLCVGSPGSQRIITATAQVISNVIDHGMSLQEAIEAPRAHINVEEFAVESRICPDVIRALRDRGHEIEVKEAYGYYFGGVNAVMYDDRSGKFYGGADPRRDGCSVG
ncbi:MAG: gamma-glutamyltransferase [Bacillota bacterium]|jgi:gamma-glutamyltranspeptidase/glutathione hydrolase